MQGTLSYDDYADGYRISPRALMDLEQARARYARAILLKWPRQRAPAVEALEACLASYRGEEGCPVTLRYRNDLACADLTLNEHWRVKVCEGLIGELRELLGRRSVQVRYRHPA